MRLAGLLHDVGHGPFAHFFDEHVLCHFPAPADPRRQHKSLTHEDLSQLIVERELGDLIRSIRRAPGAVPPRDALRPDESIDPRWLSFLISKPALADPSMPRWLRWLQPLLSGVFTVDNLDYVRRDSYLIGVSTGPVDVERLRRYSFIGPRGLSLYEPGLGALEMFLTARLFMYQQIYFHRSVRAIDLDLAEVFRPSILAIFGDGSPADELSHYADLDEYALLHQAALWARGEALARRPAPGDGTVTPEVGRVWQAILLRRPRWRAEAELRRAYEATERDAAVSAVRSELGRDEAGRRRHRPGRGGRPAGRSHGHRFAAGGGRTRRPPGRASQPGPGPDSGLLARGPAVSAHAGGGAGRGGLRPQGPTGGVGTARPWPWPQRLEGQYRSRPACSRAWPTAAWSAMDRPKLRRASGPASPPRRSGTAGRAAGRPGRSRLRAGGLD